MKVEEQPLNIIDVLENAQEAFFTGTAAVIQPITEINYDGKSKMIGGSLAEKSRTAELRRHLVGIQFGLLEDQWNWIEKVVSIYVFYGYRKE